MMAIVFEFPGESQAVGRDTLSVRVGGRQRRTLTDVGTMCGPTGPVAFVRPNTLINSRERRLQVVGSDTLCNVGSLLLDTVEIP